MPDTDQSNRKGRRRSSGKLTGPTWQEATPIYDEILKGGADNIAGLIGMLSKIDDGKDFKARYVLHAIVTYTCSPGKEAHRACVAKAIASQLSGQSKDNQAFLMRQLELCGDAKVAPAIGRFLCDEKVSAPAAAALTAIGKGAAEQFRAAMPKAKGMCLVNVVQGLGMLGDAKSAEALRKAVGDDDREVRIAAAWALANIGDAGSVDVLIKASDTKGAWERIQAAKACLVLAEKLTASGKKSQAAKLYKHLRDTRKKSDEGYLSEVAAEALAAAK